MPSALDAAKKKYDEENPNRPPRVDPKYMKEEIYSTGGKEHTHKTHTETYNSAERTTKIEDRIEEPNTKTEKIHIKNGRVTEHEVHQKQYNENTQTMEETHGIYEDAPKKINIDRKIRNGRVIGEDVTKEFFDAEIGADVHLHDVHEFPTTERQVNVRAIDGFIYEKEITEKSYNPDENVFETKHGIDQKRLDCGHIMQGTIYSCSICGRTMCGNDECGAIINGRVFCNAHAQTGYNMGQLYR